MSVEEEYARDLGLKVGSQIVFDVQGVPVPLTVSSLRKVRWESFGINFFWVVEPGVLDRAPQMRIASVRLPAGGEQQPPGRSRREPAQRHRLRHPRSAREGQRRARAHRSRGPLPRRLHGARGPRDPGRSGRRGSRAARARGGPRQGPRHDPPAGRGLFATESAIVGLLAGAIGSVAGTTLAAVVLEKGMEIPFRLEVVPPLAAIVLAALFAAAAGLAASARPLAQTAARSAPRFVSPYRAARLPKELLGKLFAALEQIGDRNEFEALRYRARDLLREHRQSRRARMADGDRRAALPRQRQELRELRRDRARLGDRRRGRGRDSRPACRARARPSKPTLPAVVRESRK